MAEQQQDPAVEEVLKRALELPKPDRQRLHSILGVLNGDAEVSPQDEAAVVPADEVESVHVWLDGLRDEKPWVRLQLVDDALEKVVTGEAAELLQRARRALIDAHPPVSIRRAVELMVKRQPIAFTLGVIGFGFAIAALGRGIFRLIF